jgi:hypothetical protein
MNRLRALLPYAPWQLRDAVPKAAVPLAIFTVVAGFPLIFLAREHTLAVLRAPGDPQTLALATYGNFLPLALALGAIILMSGGASLDRERQHVRFLFSRPVAPWLVYLQQFAISIALFAVATTILPLAFGWMVTEVPVVAVLKVAALYALAYGSLALFCGALLNRDGIAYIAAMVLAITLQTADRAGQLGTVLSALAKALPPFVALGQVRGAWLAGAAADGGDVRLVVAYGIGMTIVALWIISRRPLVR